VAQRKHSDIPLRPNVRALETDLMGPMILHAHAPMPTILDRLASRAY
jgi:hypothetical protein